MYISIRLIVLFHRSNRHCSQTSRTNFSHNMLKRVRIQNSGWAWRGALGGLLRCWSCSLSWTQYRLYHSVHCLRNHQFIYLRFVYSSVFMPYFKYKIYLNYLYRSRISLQLLMLEETTVEREKWTYTFFTREKNILL